jgi:hypothetical protein
VPTGRIIPWVFWQRANEKATGAPTVKPVKKFYTAWSYACVRAGLGTKTEMIENGRRVVKITASASRTISAAPPCATSSAPASPAQSR